MHENGGSVRFQHLVGQCIVKNGELREEEEEKGDAF